MALGYRAAVEWIALNDETAETSAAEMADLISVQMVADLSEKEPLEVATAVMRYRARHAKVAA